MAETTKIAASNWLFAPVLVIGGAIGLAVSEQVPALPLALFSASATKQVSPDYQPPVKIDIGGIPSILDGDLIEINRTPIRLHGIDAPEPGQTCTVVGTETRCGQRAAFALAGLIAGRVTGCVAKGTDRRERMSAVCHVGETELNTWMVENGWALAAGEAGAEYRAAEAAARLARRGVWGGEFVRPWDWRRGAREARISAAIVTGDDAPAARSGQEAHAQPDMTAPPPGIELPALSPHAE